MVGQNASEFSFSILNFEKREWKKTLRVNAAAKMAGAAKLLRLRSALVDRTGLSPKLCVRV